MEIDAVVGGLALRGRHADPGPEIAARHHSLALVGVVGIDDVRRPGQPLRARSLRTLTRTRGLALMLRTSPSAVRAG
jgi:hypothetical protein